MKKSFPNGPTQANPRLPVTLVVRDLGHVPAIKNSMFSIVDKKNRAWKRRCVQSFVWQFYSGTATNERVTLTLPCPPSWIASLPQDDNWKILPEIMVRSVKVPKGQEGALVEITPL